jgi:dTDP-glucose 4,6-dehydratase/UDP-glucuronate decarboxylase
LTNPHIGRDARDIIENMGDLNARFAGKTVLLTGAAGFLGSQFCHYFCGLNDSGLLTESCHLLAYDNLVRGAPAWLTEISSRPDVTFHQADIVRQTEYPRVDFIIHAASIASPTFYRMHPIETMDANVIGVRRLLEHATKFSVESMIFFSTSEIYGDPDAANIPTSEEYRGNVSCTGPRACYDESKRFGETLVVGFWEARGVPVKTVRPFNNYGPGLAIGDKRVLPDFFQNVLDGNDIVLLSDGTATRTFCYSADAITGYLLALVSEHHGEAFNIGTESPEISMLELARRVIEISGKPLRVAYEASADPNYLKDNPQRRCPSIAKARAMLSYAPKVSLDEGLERMWAYYLDSAGSPAGRVPLPI